MQCTLKVLVGDVLLPQACLSNLQLPKRRKEETLPPQFAECTNFQPEMAVEIGMPLNKHTHVHGESRKGWALQSNSVPDGSQLSRT